MVLIRRGGPSGTKDYVDPDVPQPLCWSSTATDKLFIPLTPHRALSIELVSAREPEVRGMARAYPPGLEGPAAAGALGEEPGTPRGPSPVRVGAPGLEGPAAARIVTGGS